MKTTLLIIAVLALAACAEEPLATDDAGPAVPSTSWEVIPGPVPRVVIELSAEDQAILGGAPPRLVAPEIVLDVAVGPGEARVPARLIPPVVNLGTIQIAD